MGQPPTPSGSLTHEDMGVFLSKQALVPFWGGDLPDYLQVRDWDRLPESQGVFGSDTPYMLWVVAFNFAEAPPDYVIPGLVRWWSLTPGADPVMMFETPVRLTREDYYFYEGLGSDAQLLWRPGIYRVELVDTGGEVLARDAFEVRS